MGFLGKKASLGLKKGGKLIDRHAEVIAPIASSVGSAIAEEPVVITPEQLRMVGGEVRNTGKGIEKLRKGDLGGAFEKLAESRLV